MALLPILVHAGSSPTERIAQHCEPFIGEPRVLQVTPRVKVAIGYEIANVILIQTDEGVVVVDAGLSPKTARAMREELFKGTRGPVRALIYTHSHIDHIGGASVWAEKGTQIWATEAFTEHFLKQYGFFQQAEATRGARQFGRHVPDDQLPCSALARRPTLDSTLKISILMPTHTFSGKKVLTIGGTEIHLVEAHGETHDQLFVWVPAEKALMPGDNFYHAFPNLYTIRGTTARPVNDWIESLDKMRALQPEHLVPSHTVPVSGAEKVQEVLRDYRDAIQWVRDEVVRRANSDQSLEEIAAAVKLPSHLSQKPYLAELYGQVDWSAKGIYVGELGWFDGEAYELYPLPAGELARREVELAGGFDRVLEQAREALQGGEAKWALHLLAKLKRSGLAEQFGYAEHKLDSEMAAALVKVAEDVTNTNGRAYLLEYAYELTHGPDPLPIPPSSDAFLQSIPLEFFFRAMAIRLNPRKAADTHESAQFVFPDKNSRFTVTQRYGVAEVAFGEPFPGTPPPIAVLTTDSLTWKRLALGQLDPLQALREKKLKIKGNMGRFLLFVSRFER